MAGAENFKTLSYADLATALGIGDKSCRNLVRRKGWRRRPGNDGTVRIDVPIEALERDASTDASTRAPISSGTSSSTDTAIDNAAMEVLRSEIATLQAAVARAEATATERGLTVEHERRRADEAQAELRRVMDRLMRMQEDRARPWWRRLVG